MLVFRVSVGSLGHKRCLINLLDPHWWFGTTICGFAFGLRLVFWMNIGGSGQCWSFGPQLVG